MFWHVTIFIHAFWTCGLSKVAQWTSHAALSDCGLHLKTFQSQWPFILGSTCLFNELMRWGIFGAIKKSVYSKAKGFIFYFYVALTGNLHPYRLLKIWGAEWHLREPDWISCTPSGLDTALMERTILWVHSQTPHGIWVTYKPHPQQTW